MHVPLSLSLVALALPLLAVPPTTPRDREDPNETWVTWRGNDGNGVSPDGTPPIEWSEEKNVRWKTPLPGLGLSTPIVSGDRLYLTTAVETDELGESPVEPVGRAKASDRVHEFQVLAVNRSDGSIAWTTVVARAVPHEIGHRTNSLASGSCVTDGEKLYAFFGSRGVHCLDLDGRLQWSKQLGHQRTRHGFGEGASAALGGNMLVVPWDHEEQSFVVGLDKHTGEEKWRHEREETTGWSTPLIVEWDGRLQAILPAHGFTLGYDVETGEPIWSMNGMTKNCTPTPNYADGVVYVMSGFRGAALQAIRLEGAKGYLGDTDCVQWTHDRNTPYTPSGLLYDGLLYFTRVNTGVLSCLEAADGTVHYEGARLEGVRELYASPVGADGRVYIPSREGVTSVIQAGKEFKLLATNKLDDCFDASPVVVGKELYLRGKNLYCLAED